MHEVIGRAQLSHNDGKGQLQAVCNSAAGTTEHREVQISSGKLTIKNDQYLFLFHIETPGLGYKEHVH